MDNKIAWKTLVDAIPGLRALVNEALCVKDLRAEESFCAKDIWSSRFRPKLVGAIFFAPEGVLEPTLTYDAYELVYREILSSLPPCRNCSCVKTGQSAKRRHIPRGEPY